MNIPPKFNTSTPNLTNTRWGSGATLMTTAVKSDDIQAEFFVNYLPDKSRDLYGHIHKIEKISLLLKNDSEWERYFEWRNVYDNEADDEARLLRIITAFGFNEVQLHNIRKYKFIEDTGIQLFFIAKGVGIYELALIDLWHLSFDPKTHGHNRNKIYKQHRIHRRCLSSVWKA